MLNKKQKKNNRFRQFAIKTALYYFCTQYTSSRHSFNKYRSGGLFENLSHHNTARIIRQSRRTMRGVYANTQDHRRRLPRRVISADSSDCGTAECETFNTHYNTTYTRVRKRKKKKNITLSRGVIRLT